MPHSNKVCEDNTAFLENRIKHLEAENLRLTEQHEVVRKAYVLACQTAERYREALEKILKDWGCNYMDCQECGGTKTARKALDKSDSNPKPGEGEKP